MGTETYYYGIRPMENDPAARPHLEKFVRENPLRCSPSAMTQTFVCAGAVWLEGQPGYIVDWDADAYWIVSALEFEGGDHDTMIVVHRSDATCVDSTPPSLDTARTWRNT